MDSVECISNNLQFIVWGFARSGISLSLNGINIEEDSDEDASDDDDNGEVDDDDNGEVDDDDEKDDEEDYSNEEYNEGDEEEEASSEYEHSDEELYIEDGAELNGRLSTGSVLIANNIIIYSSVSFICWIKKMLVNL